MYFGLFGFAPTKLELPDGAYTPPAAPRGERRRGAARLRRLFHGFFYDHDVRSHLTAAT